MGRAASAFGGLLRQRRLQAELRRVPAYPLSYFARVSHLGPHTMSVRDSALMMNVLSQPDARDWTSLPPDGRDYLVGLEEGSRDLRIAWSPTLGYARNVDPEIAVACERALVRWRLGAIVEAVDPGIEDPLEITADSGSWAHGLCGIR